MTGYLGLLSSLLNNKTRIVTRNTFTPKLMLEIIKKYQVNCLFSPPSQLALILQLEQEICSADLDSVQEWIVGGSFVAKEFCLRINEHLRNGRVYSCYGSSELAGLIARCGENYESLGRLSMGITVKIVDGDGQLLGPNERGEICVRCGVVPTTFGYFNNEEATNSTFVDGWWHSGDLGFIDRNGDLHVVDRMRDILKFMGHRVEPTELETLIQTMPGVAMVAVIGISHPIHNDLPAAVIIKSTSGSIDEKMVETFVENSLSNHKWLRGGVHFVDEMPMNASGKVLKRQLKEQIERKVMNKN